MNVEKIFKREDGSQIKIVISVYIELYCHSESAQYNTNISIRGKGKKKWVSIHNFDDYSWRALSMPDRTIANRKKELEYVTLAEMQTVALELWEKLKPTFTT